MTTSVDSTSPAPELIDIRAVAERLKCSTKTVERMAARGEMPPRVKLRRLTRWPRAVIERWVAAGCPPCAHPAL